MITKKQKRASREKKTNHKGNFILLSALCPGIVIILALGLYLTHSNRTTPPHPYEEVYSSTSDFNKEIGKIDNAIYESLYLRGIPEKDIFFLAIKPRYEEGYEWDFTKLLIKLSNSDSVRQLEKIIDIELSPLRPSVSYKTEEISHREIVYHIFTLGHYTHKISLISKRYQKPFHEGLPKIAIIIDDLGYDRHMAISFLQLDLPLCFSVLPLAPYTKDIAHEANKRGRDLILHLPMEPNNFPSLDPGPGALLTDMDEGEIRRTLGDHLKRIPGVRGVSNHMGSYFTARQDKMDMVLRELKERRLFYIDSRTTTQTVAFDLAKKMGLPVANRNVFLDNDLSPNAIKFQMERLLGIARYSGGAIGIGHPHKETLKILKLYLPKLKTDFKVVPVSKLVS